MSSLANYKDFAKLVATQEKLEGSKALKQVFNVPVVEYALQTEIWTLGQFQRVVLRNVVTEIRSVWTGVFGMEKSQHSAAGLEHVVDFFHHRFHHGFGKIIGNVPSENGIELPFAVIKIL